MVGVWLTEKGFGLLFQEQDPKFFDLCPVRWFFDAGEVGVLIVFVVFRYWYSALRATETVITMSMSAPHNFPARASLSSQVFRWALPRLAIYAGAAVGCMIVFTAGAAFYAYVWPGVPHPALRALTRPPPLQLPPVHELKDPQIHPQQLPSAPGLEQQPAVTSSQPIDRGPQAFAHPDRAPIVTQPLVAQRLTTGTELPRGTFPRPFNVVDLNGSPIGEVYQINTYQVPEPEMIIDWRRGTLHAWLRIPVSIVSFQKEQGAGRILIPFQAADIEERVRTPRLDKARQIMIPVPNKETGEKFLIFEVVATN